MTACCALPRSILSVLTLNFYPWQRYYLGNVVTVFPLIQHPTFFPNFGMKLLGIELRNEERALANFTLYFRSFILQLSILLMKRSLDSRQMPLTSFLFSFSRSHLVLQGAIAVASRRIKGLWRWHSEALKKSKQAST